MVNAIKLRSQRTRIQSGTRIQDNITLTYIKYIYTCIKIYFYVHTCILYEIVYINFIIKKKKKNQLKINLTYSYDGQQDC